MPILNIGKNFSTHPIGRYYSDGDGSGEEFREKQLKTCISDLADNESLEIVLDDGVDGYGSSFLDESFGGLVRFGYFKAEFLLEHLVFTYTDEDFSFFEEKIFQYISRAKYRSETYTKGAG